MPSYRQRKYAGAVVGGSQYSSQEWHQERHKQVVPFAKVVVKEARVVSAEGVLSSRGPVARSVGVVARGGAAGTTGGPRCALFVFDSWISVPATEVILVAASMVSSMSCPGVVGVVRSPVAAGSGVSIISSPPACIKCSDSFTFAVICLRALLITPPVSSG